MNAPHLLQSMPEPRLPAPASWARVDAPRRPVLVQVTVELPTGRTSYCREFGSALDAYDDALTRYPDCISIDAQPATKAEVQP